MWIVELNILGHKFTRTFDVRRPAFVLGPRTVSARLSQLRQARVAA